MLPLRRNKGYKYLQWHTDRWQTRVQASDNGKRQFTTKGSLKVDQLKLLHHSSLEVCTLSIIHRMFPRSLTKTVSPETTCWLLRWAYLFRQVVYALRIKENPLICHQICQMLPSKLVYIFLVQFKFLARRNQLLELWAFKFSRERWQRIKDFRGVLEVSQLWLLTVKYRQGHLNTKQ